MSHKIVWQAINTPHPFRLGKCKACKLRFAWPADKLHLTDMSCPQCGGPLAPTTLIGALPFTDLARSPAGQSASAPVIDAPTHTHTVLASYGHPERVGAQVPCSNAACLAPPQSRRPKSVRPRTCPRCHQQKPEGTIPPYCADCLG